MSHRPTILVVDDDYALVNMIAEVLSDERRNVLTASGASEAMRYLSRYEIDVLVTDIRMPGGMDGFQLAAEAKRMCPKLRVIYLSGQRSSELGSAGPLLGPILQKPFRMAVLLEEIGSTPVATATS